MGVHTVQDELRSQTGRITELDAHLSRETGAAAAARESQEQLRGANMQLGLQLERLQQKLGAEQIARSELSQKQTACEIMLLRDAHAV